MLAAMSDKVTWLKDSALRFGIDAAFRENGIEIPFPQRDLHIRSGLPKELTPDGADGQMAA